MTTALPTTTVVEEYLRDYFTQEEEPARKRRRRHQEIGTTTTTALHEHQQIADAVERHLSDVAYAKAPLDMIKSALLDAQPDLAKESLAYEIIDVYQPLDENIVRFVVESITTFTGTELTSEVLEWMQAHPFVHAMLILGVHMITNDDDDADLRFTSRRTEVLMCIFTRVRATPELRLALAYAMVNRRHATRFLLELDKQQIFADLAAKYPLALEKGGGGGGGGGVIKGGARHIEQYVADS